MQCSSDSTTCSNCDCSSEAASCLSDLGHHLATMDDPHRAHVALLASEVQSILIDEYPSLATLEGLAALLDSDSHVKVRS